MFQCAEAGFLLTCGRNTNIGQNLVLNINNSDGKKFQESLGVNGHTWIRW